MTDSAFRAFREAAQAHVEALRKVAEAHGAKLDATYWRSFPSLKARVVLEVTQPEAEAPPVAPLG